MTAVRGMRAALKATVDVRRGGKSFGHGLLLNVEGNVVLTCHHIVGNAGGADLEVVARNPDGTTTSSPATVDAERSHPVKDAIVLHVERDLGPRDQPWLHAPGPDYGGKLPATVALSARRGRLNTFDGVLGPVTEDFTVDQYVLPRAFPLGRAEEAPPGISGGVAVCEDGVVGLVHFARQESAELGRSGVVNPLSAWAEDWPELAHRIQPFADKALSDLAIVVRADADELGEILRIKFFRDVYVPRGVETAADEALKASRSLLLLGGPKSGKTRIVREVLRAHADAVVVVPTFRSPPLHFEPSSLSGTEVILVVDNLGRDGAVFDSSAWLERIEAVNEEGTIFVATCRTGEDWERVRETHVALAERLTQSTVHTSDPPEGSNFTSEQARELARKLELSDAELDRRFDGSTPGSLFEEGPRADGPELPSGRGREIALRNLQGHEAPSNVPAFTSKFVGREDDVEALKQLVREERLVTVTGPSGRGKTRLAFHATAQLRDEFADGVWVADLSPYRTPALVLSVVARAVRLGDAPSPQPLERLAAFLSDKHVLLVLNGCDHVRDASARLLEELVDRCLHLHCLATCRSTLDARGEVLYRLDSLSAEPSAGRRRGRRLSEAAELLVERARESGSKKRFSRRDYAAVAEIARVVAGNPLAIELVAGQVGGRALRGVAATLAERVAAAEGPEGETEPLDAAVDLVAGALAESEQLLFGSVAVFVGGFTLEAAQALGARAGLDAFEIPGLLRSLIDRRLILIDERGDGADRFRILETLRQHGRRRLDEGGRLGEMERFHAEYFLALAEGANEAKGEPGEAAWLDRLDGELENVRAALWWALRADTDIALGLGASLGWFWYQRGHVAEGRRWLDELLETLDTRALANAESEEVRIRFADLFNGAGTFAYLQGDLDNAEKHHRQALVVRESLATDRWVAGSRNNLGLVARRRGKRGRAARHFRKALEISRAHGNAFWEAMHLNNLGLLLREAGDLASARRRQEESLTIAARLGASWGTAQALAALGVLDADEGRLDSAREFLERARAIHVELQNPQGIAEALAGLGRVARLAGRSEESADCYREAVGKAERLGDRAALAEMLEGLGMTLVESDAASAARAFGAAKRIRVTIGFPRPPYSEEELMRALEIGREQLGVERFEGEHRTGLQARVAASVAALGIDGGR